MTLIEPVSTAGLCRGYRRVLPAFDKEEAMKAHEYAVGYSINDALVYRSSWDDRRSECKWSFQYDTAQA